MLLLQRDWIGTEDLSGLVRAGTRVLFRLPADGLNLDDVQRQLLVQALERAGGNQTQAGHLLGLNRDQVRYQLKKFHLPLLRPAAAIQ